MVDHFPPIREQREGVQQGGGSGTVGRGPGRGVGRDPGRGVENLRPVWGLHIFCVVNLGRLLDGISIRAHVLE